MYRLVLHVRPNGSCPYDEYVMSVFQSGRKQEAAKIRATVDRLIQSGSDGLVKLQRAEKMNDVWQLRIVRHRVFYALSTFGMGCPSLRHSERLPEAIA